MSILHSWYETRSFFTRENLKKMAFLVWRGWVHFVKFCKDQPFYGILLLALLVAGLLQGPKVSMGTILLMIGFKALLIAMVRPSLFPAKINLFDWRFIGTYGVCLYFGAWTLIFGSWLLLLPIGDYAVLVGFLLFDAQSGSDVAKSFVRAGRMWLYNLPILIVFAVLVGLLMFAGTFVSGVLMLPFALLIGKEIGFMIGRFLLLPFVVFIVSCNIVFLSLLYSIWTVKDYSNYME